MFDSKFVDDSLQLLRVYLGKRRARAPAPSGESVVSSEVVGREAEPRPLKLIVIAFRKGLSDALGSMRVGARSDRRRGEWVVDGYNGRVEELRLDRRYAVELG